MAENSGGAPVTVKCRVGVDDVDSYDALCAFVERVSANMPPCPSANDKPLFAIHARKALLNGLSPAENRAVPPLRREWVYALARDFPDVAFALNGGILDVETAVAIANEDDFSVNTNMVPLIGSMIGRASHADPWGVLATADVEVFGRGRRSRDGDEPPSVARGVRRVLRRDTGTVRDHEGRVCRAVHQTPGAPDSEPVLRRAERQAVATRDGRRVEARRQEPRRLGV